MKNLRHQPLVPFPFEYALYRIPVSPARHSRLRGNPELEVTFQYRQDHLETVLTVSNFVLSLLYITFTTTQRRKGRKVAEIVDQLPLLLPCQ